MQWFSIYYSYLSRLDFAFKMSNRSKQARIVPETPDNSSSDDEQEQEGEELQVGANIWKIFEKYLGNIWEMIVAGWIRGS